MTEDLTKKLPQSADEKLTLILTTVQSLTVRVDSIDSRLRRVEETIDDARPVWQLLIIDIAHLREGQLILERGQRRLEEGQRRLEERCGRLEEGQKSLEERQKSLHSDLTVFRRRVDQQFLTLSGTVESRFREHDQRITRLETNTNQADTQT
jgi:predicted  nucleic acid-binding Zn-ribbon protein